MLKVVKWIGIVLGSLLVLVVLLLAGLYTKSRLEFTRKYSVQVEAVTVPTDADSIARGKHLASVLCMECHGDDLGGNPKFFDGGPLGTAASPNLTSGPGGLGAEFTDQDFVRVLRHGVKPNGQSVFIMPSVDFRNLSDQDLGDIIAYLRSAPPVDRQTPEPHARFTVMANILYGAGQFGHLLRAETIEKLPPPAPAPAAGVTPEYGEYLVNINGCRSCHGQQLAGGKPGDPASIYAPNLTPGGYLKVVTEADFLKMLHTGVTPTGGILNPRFMPWEHKGLMTDDELKAIWAYLQTLPALPTSYAPAEP